MATLEEKVCPRCGESAGGQRFCGSCGLNLYESEPLSTDEYAARLREEQWLRRQSAMTPPETDVSSPSAHLAMAAPHAPTEPVADVAAAAAATAAADPAAPSAAAVPTPGLSTPTLASDRPTQLSTRYWIMFGGLVLSGIAFVLYAVEALRWINDVNQLLSGNAAGVVDVGSARSAVNSAQIFIDVASVVSSISFIVWFFGAYKNMDLRGFAIRFTRGWAIGAWFVPFLNLVRPKQIANDLWRGRDLHPRGEELSRRPVSNLLHWWWGLYWGATVPWLVGVLLSQKAYTVNDSLSHVLRVQRTGFSIALIGVGVWFAAGVLIAIVGHQLTQAQDRALQAGPGALAGHQMQDTRPQAAPAGWYPQGEKLRYWDGVTWTEHFSDKPPTVGAPQNPAA